MPVINTRESSPARTPKTITNFGTPSPITSNVQVKIGNAAYFSNTQSAYLQVTNSAGSLNFGTNPFTVEFWWFKPSATRPSSFPTIISNFNGSDFGYVANSWVLQENRIDTANRVSLGVPNVNGSGAAFFIAGTTNLAANTWYNIAVTRTGSTWRLFLNGNIEATGTSAASLDGNNNRNLYISQPQSVTWINGYIDELRVSNSARYTANYTVDTNAFTNDANTMLLMHMDGANGANLFTDDGGSITSSTGINIDYSLSSGNIRTALLPTSVNSAAVSNTQVALGNGSVGLLSNNQGIVTTNTGGALNLGNRDFTIEFRIYPTSKVASFPNAIYAPLGGATVGGVYGLEVDGSIANKYIFYAPNYTGGSPISSVLLTSTSNVAYNAWTAVAITRSGSTFRLFINGNIESTATFAGSLDNDNRANVVFGTAGTTGSNFIRGYMDEIRMSNVARYTANYTVATTPFVCDANTTLLMHCDGTVGSTSFPDDNVGVIGGGLTFNLR